MDYARQIQDLLLHLPLPVARILREITYEQADETGFADAVDQLKKAVKDQSFLLWVEVNTFSDEDQVEELFRIWGMSDGSLAELEREYQLVDGR